MGDTILAIFKIFKDAPGHIWFVAFTVCCILFFMPSHLEVYFGISDGAGWEIFPGYSGFVFICFITTSIVCAMKVAAFIVSAIRNYKHVDTCNLNDEEKAILFFYAKNQYKDMELPDEHPTVASLCNRNFLKARPSLVYVVGNPLDFYVLTKNGKKKLKSRNFQKSQLSDLNEDRVLSYINNITGKKYQKHQPAKLR